MIHENGNIVIEFRWQNTEELEQYANSIINLINIVKCNYLFK